MRGSGSPEKRGSGPVLPHGNTVPATHTIPDCLAAALKRWEATSENYWSNIFYLTQIPKILLFQQVINRKSIPVCLSRQLYYNKIPHTVGL